MQTHMLKCTHFCLTFVSYFILVAVSIAWPRSYFYSDKWWVENTSVQEVPSSTAGAKWTTGYDPTRWSQGVAWLSGEGCLTFHHIDYTFAPGELRSQQFSRPVMTAAWLPSTKWFGFTVPYWCIALAAAFLPAISLRRVVAGLNIFRFRITLFFYLALAASLVLTGLVNLGTGGAVIGLEVAVASFVAVCFIRRVSAGTSRMNHPARSQPAPA